MFIPGRYLKTLIIFQLLLITGTAKCQFVVDSTHNIKRIMDFFLSPRSGIEISNIKYKGNRYSIGLFATTCQALPIRKGIILSTGDIWEAAGPNNYGSFGNNHHRPGDKELETLANGKTFDAAILEFDFSANSDSISFEYIFASEEYPEYVNKGLNDVFAFFVSETSTQVRRNIALCNNLPVTVNNINAGSNKAYFISNDRNRGGCLATALQFDGLTTRLSTGFMLKPYETYHFKICIADVGDGLFDSAVMLRSSSFASTGKIDIPRTLEEISSAMGNKTNVIKSDSTSLYVVPNILFDFDSYTLPDTSDAVLKHLSGILKKYYDFNIEIMGYADSIGSLEYNNTLSLKRAETVANYLINEKIASTRLLAKGLGSTNPIGKNNTDSGRAQNRRVIVRIFKKPDKIF